jgi:hypothetical protein
MQPSVKRWEKEGVLTLMPSHTALSITVANLNPPLTFVLKFN